MTSSQKNTYFAIWGDVCAAQGWSILSAKERDAKRHLTTLTALKKDKSSKEFNDADLDRIFALFAVLIDPNNLDAQLVWQAYENGEDPGLRKRLLHAIESAAAPAYTFAVMRDKFGTDRLSNLSNHQLTDLRNTLNCRTGVKR